MTKAALQIAKNFTLPLEAVTQTFAILAKRRAGKSYTARRFSEELLEAGQQVVIVDPKGDWWGIRSGADGKSAGYPVVILGGEHGDLPLEVNASEIVAKLVVQEQVSVLIDLSEFRKTEVARFMGGELGTQRAGFLEALYRLKNREEHRTPLMLIVDEADAIAPQKPFKGEERMLGAMEDIVRRGGQRGIGCLTVTQRSAVLNKNVLTQSQVLVAMRTIAPQDLQAMEAWIDVHGTEGERKILMASLPSLPTGDAWFWSPGWPTDDGIFRRVSVSRIRTFDSGATPKPGEKRITPKTLADVDLEAVKRQMAETVERVKADDPRELRRRIVELERELGTGKTAAAPVSAVADTKVLEASRQEGYRAGYQEGFKAGAAAESNRLRREIGNAVTGLGELTRKLNEASTSDPAAVPAKVPHPAAAAVAATNSAAPRSHSVTVQRPPAAELFRARPDAAKASTNGNLAGGERKILNVLAQYPQGRSKVQIALLAGYAHNGGGFNNYLSGLRSKGYIEGRGDVITATPAGLHALGPYEPLPTGRSLVEYWLRQLDKAPRLILEQLVNAYPNALTKDEVAVLAGYEANGGGFNNALSRLRTLELIEGRGSMRASDGLFQ